MDNKDENMGNKEAKERAKRMLLAKRIRGAQKKKEMDSLMREINVSILIENKLFANKLSQLSKQLKDGCDVERVADELSKLSDDLLKLVK